MLDRGRCLLEDLPRIKTDACSENGGPDALGEMAKCFRVSKDMWTISSHMKDQIFMETYGTLRKNILNGRTKCGPVGWKLSRFHDSTQRATPQAYLLPLFWNFWMDSLKWQKHQHPLEPQTPFLFLNVSGLLKSLEYAHKVSWAQSQSLIS